MMGGSLGWGPWAAAFTSPYVNTALFINVRTVNSYCFKVANVTIEMPDHHTS